MKRREMYLPKSISKTCQSLFLILAFATATAAQTTAFTYQGRLTDSAPAGGSYLFKFSLFSQLENGAAIDTLNDVPATVANGVFTVELNFTAQNAFDGGERYLEIGVKRTTDPAGTPYTTLTPRQRIASVPYAIRAKNPADGFSALISTTTEAAGANCAAGGTKIETGLDANRNGTLEAGEINAAQTRYVCNGAVPAFYTRQGSTATVQPGNTLNRTAICNSGDIAIGGGFSTNLNVNVFKSGPSASNPGAWEASFSNPTNNQYGVSVYVVCLDLPPLNN